MGAARVPVLMYHRVDPSGDDPALCVKPRRFDAQMNWLAGHGYHPCRVAEFCDWYLGQAELPPGSILLSFDDGYAGLHEHVLPLLAERRWPATVFLVSRMVGAHDAWAAGEDPRGGTRALLSRLQIEEMGRHGFEFQSHSQTHADLTTLDSVRLREQVDGSRRELEELLGRPVDCFAYPYGRVNDAVRGAVEQAGYRVAFSVRSGFNRPGGDPLDVRRLDITGRDTRARVGRKVSMGTNDGSWQVRLRYLASRLAPAGAQHDKRMSEPTPERRQPALRVVVGFCTYNRAKRLPALAQALRAQDCDEPFEIVVVDNNSPDDARSVLARLAAGPGAPLRFVTETEQGIVPARNRLLAEAAGAEFLLMLDDDELPEAGWLRLGLTALRDEGLDCVGGRVRVQFEPHERPRWLGPELLGFLAEVDYGDAAFVIRDESTPVWTANVGYRMSLFADGLCYDRRYSRVGGAVGGGEDVMMFQALLRRGSRIGYRPAMVVRHFVEPWRLQRRYFLRLHYSSGVRAGLYDTPDSPRRLFGAPLYLYPQAARQGWRTLLAFVTSRGWVRQGMNFTYAWGRILGAMRRGRSQPVR